jgi:hypothetical protein
VVELALTEMANDPRWASSSEQAIALRELGRRRARIGAGDQASIDEEIAMLTALRPFYRAAVAGQWLSELTPEQRQAIRANPAAIPKSLRAQLAMLSVGHHG